MAVVPLQYRFDGPPEGPVVLLVPPIGAKWSVWEPQMPELTRCLRVLRVNHRGHGASPAPPGGAAVDDLGADAAALLDRLDLDRVRVVGAGMGGAAVATWLAVHRAKRVHRLAYVAGAARLPHAEHWRSLAARARAEGMAAVRTAAALSWFTPGFAEERPDVVGRMGEELAGVDPAGFAACWEAAAEADQFPDISRIRAPALVVSGAHDAMLPPGHGRRLAAGIPGARFEQVRGAAHLAGVERPDRVNELLLAHVAQ
ncbi:alpha/beta hydrolase [Nocardiopsis sp. RSe5-2]|uniref:Alpha/beta hydrolase n=1 Tax=Nocardiopsis endophytica TaxID=3018445 RepID=A0ABT4TY65_9ACTN|nr:alpha/beta hydrolase [Nocardiopsis endophytica]MDA2809642.1 alpha/beta hydrolase [Nocardiopsis endophytica]